MAIERQMLCANGDKRCIYRLLSSAPFALAMLRHCLLITHPLLGARSTVSTLGQQPTNGGLANTTQKCAKKTLLVGWGIRVSGEYL